MATNEGATSPTADLAAYLSAQAGHDVAVVGLARISNGWESDVYAFDAPQWVAGGRVLRLYFGVNAGATALHEYRSLDLLARAGYPVPRVDLAEPSTQLLGRAFLIMERVEGQSLGVRWRDPDPVVREHERARFCALLAQLHTLEWQHLAGAEHVPSLTLAQQIASWEAYGTQFPSESLRRAIAWLYEASQAVVPQPPGLVHWDFHPENILVDSDGRAQVIDWTQFQATDTRFDLAWTLVLLASERDWETSQAVRAGYAAQRGWDAARVQDDLRFFEAAACGKRLLSVLISLTSGADAVGMRPGAEAVIRSRLARIAIVYQRWLALTETPLPEVAEMLAGYL
jgi:aminoglycoside phosphotransferase (APT) family kinase protein